MTDLSTVVGDGPLLVDIRPSRETILAAKRRALPATLVVAAAGIFRGIAFGSHIHSMAVWAMVAVGLGLAAVTAIGLWALYLSNARLLVTAESFGRTTILGRPRLKPRRSLARALKVSVYAGASVPAPQWLFLDGEGNRLLAVSWV